MKYNDTFGEVLNNMKTEIDVTRRTRMQTKRERLLVYFDKYDEKTLNDIISYFMNAVKWHSTTQHHSYKRSEISNNPTAIYNK